jgi:hypothetical protein
VTAANAPQALEFFKAARFALVITDHLLGRTTATAMIEEMKRINPAGRLAANFGPLAEVNSGPSAGAYWTGVDGVGDAMCPGLKRSESLGHIECDRSACFLAPAFLHRAPETVAVRAGLDDVCPIRDAVQQCLA